MEGGCLRPVRFDDVTLGDAFTEFGALNSLEVSFADGEQVLFSQVIHTDDHITRITTAQRVLVLAHICGKIAYEVRDQQPLHDRRATLVIYVRSEM